jgi:hypothetical protein
VRVDCALLCDAVTVREGLLHILGGGITRLGRPTYPAPMAVSLALRILLHPSEAGQQHKVRLEIVTQDGEQVGQVDAAFQAERPAAGVLEPGEELAVAIPIPLGFFALPKPGSYVINILLNGMHQVSLPIRASDQPVLPPTAPPALK